MKSVLILLLGLTFAFSTKSQNADSIQLRGLFEQALTGYESYNQLKELCIKAPGRLAGSTASDTAIVLVKRMMLGMNFDTVYLQPCYVRKWDRLSPEICYATDLKKGKTKFNVLSLGGSASTPSKGIEKEVVQVSSLDELKKLGYAKVNGKIVFYNAQWNDKNINPFRSYGELAGFRVHGAKESALLGAVAVIFRSINPVTDDFPHTGIVRYVDSIAAIPAVAISTADADQLAEMLLKNPEQKLFLSVQNKISQDVASFNVIGEIRGQKNPNIFLTVGGHLDSWYNTQGANDDAAGVIQSLEVARLFGKCGIKPNYTLRVVAFMDEEMAQRGGKTYATEAVQKGEKHLFAIESDRGAGAPLGFSLDVSESAMQKILGWKKLFEPYFIYQFEKGGSGVDVGPLKETGAMLAGYVPQAQKYFIYHHSEADTWDKVDRREMQMGAAAMASILFLIDKYF